MPHNIVIKTMERSERPAGRRNLVDIVGQKLREEILGGILKPGEKLPSESGLTDRYKVSRTVIREAIASMRADGLVEVRHGVGVFVRHAPPFPIAGLLNTDSGRISSIIEMLELRAAVETEAAGLAAARRSPAQDEAIMERFEDIDRAIERGIATSEVDFEFHLAIADATNNPRFREFLELTGKRAIPRSFLQDQPDEIASADYLARIQTEHRRIAEAISDRDEHGAREAMRLHLKGSQQRYRSLIRKGS
ncbi:FadR/GntR family transcriptional regulator (plasmid) [Rhizobium sp. CB3090]|uniref:FadR/GntR family transcriptional regulator n=1 Tax=Rhizobium sp. CB3090 TaxID=3039156 RepID=UPI0024B13FA8|nr:FadR/GntR family transcriptional regulator [Rhizobium sp. CB3090]WFU12544.1 FadR/GntR family transcriptional regulator [Rhizobium sp. CB3090]